MADPITLKDVYDAIDRLEDKIVERMDKTDEKLDNRVRKLEDFQSRILGIASILAIFVSGVVSIILERFK